MGDIWTEREDIPYRGWNNNFAHQIEPGRNVHGMFTRLSDPLIRQVVFKAPTARVNILFSFWIQNIWFPTEKVRVLFGDDVS